MLVSRDGTLLDAARNTNARNRCLHAEVNLLSRWLPGFAARDDWLDPSEEATMTGGGSGDDDEAVRCAPRDAWRLETPVAPSASDAPGTMKLWLLGDRARRGQAERTLPLRVDRERTLEALTQARACTRFEEILE